MAVINVIVMVQSFYLLNCRSRTRSIFSIGLFTFAAVELEKWLRFRKPQPAKTP